MNTNRAHRIRCADCADGHSTVSEVKECHAEFLCWEWQVKAEQAAEAAAARYWEEGTAQQQMLSQWELEEDMRRSALDPVWNN